MSHALIERFRNQKPTSRAERNFLRTTGEVAPLWWQKKEQLGEDSTLDLEGPPLRDAKSLQTRTAPHPRRRQEPHYDTEQFSSIDDLVFGDINKSYSNETRHVNRSTDLPPSPRLSVYNSFEKPIVRPRFRFTSNNNSSNFDSSVDGIYPVTSKGGNRVDDSFSDLQMKSRSSLIVDENEPPFSRSKQNEEEPTLPKYNQASDIGLMLEDTLSKLNERLTAQNEGAPDYSPLPSHHFDVFRDDAEDLPSTISAVREELEANLMCFNLLFESKFKLEDEADDAAKAAQALQREEIVHQVQAEQAMSRLFEPLEDIIDPRDDLPPPPQYEEVIREEEEKLMIEHVDDGMCMIDNLSEKEPQEQPHWLPKFRKDQCHFVKVSRSSVVPLESRPSPPPDAPPSPQHHFTLAATSRGVCNELDEVMDRLQYNLEKEEHIDNSPNNIDSSNNLNEIEVEEVEKKETKNASDLEREAALAVLEAALDEEDAQVQWRHQLSDLRKGWMVYQTQDSDELAALRSFRESLRESPMSPPVMRTTIPHDPRGVHGGIETKPFHYNASSPPSPPPMPPPHFEETHPSVRNGANDLPIHDSDRFLHRPVTSPIDKPAPTAFKETLTIKDRLEQFREQRKKYSKETAQESAGVPTNARERLKQLKIQRSQLSMGVPVY